jgi:hypothetical protein
MAGISKKQKALNLAKDAKNHRIAARNSLYTPTGRKRLPRKVELGRGWISHPFGFDDDVFEAGFFSDKADKQEIAHLGLDFSTPSWEVDTKRGCVNAFYSEKDLKVFWADALELSMKILRDNPLDKPSDELDFLSNQICADICAELDMDYCALLKHTAAILLKDKHVICEENMKLLLAFSQLTEERRTQESNY